MDCTELTCNKLIPIYDKHKFKSITFKNNQQNEIKIIKVDGCIITEGKRCDYLVIDSLENEHFIEIKGKDISHALAQIEESIKQLSKRSSIKIFSYIISSGSPALNTRIQNIKQKFEKNNFCKLVIKTNRHEVHL